MDVYKTPGAFSWSELLTTDPAKAAEFYGGLFGWKLEDMPMPQGTYRVAKIGETSIGGLMSVPQPGMPAMWGVYMTVENVDDTVAKCKALGGTVLMEPFDVPTVGRMAVLKDPQGAFFNVISYAMGA